MRLSTKQIDAIKKAVTESLGEGAEVYLFGSRTDDARRGGDIDLLVAPHRDLDPDKRFDARLEILASLHRRLGERKIDLIFRQPDQTASAFQRLVQDQAIRL